eukprot:Polyplicarium_translucidae@DN773_c0_g1_i1.p2
MGRIRERGPQQHPRRGVILLAPRALHFAADRSEPLGQGNCHGRLRGEVDELCARMVCVRRHTNTTWPRKREADQSTPMKSLPLKLTDQVQLFSALRATCRATYGEEQAAAVSPYLEEMHRLRAEICTITAHSCMASARRTLIRYLGFCDIAKRTLSLGHRDERALQFSWSDSLRPKSMCRSKCVNFERACVSYNIAAVESEMGYIADRSTDCGVKTALRLFQTVASRLSQLRDQILPLVEGNSSPDLSEAMLSMCVAMLLAQAQSCFYERC